MRHVKQSSGANYNADCLDDPFNRTIPIKQLSMQQQQLEKQAKVKKFMPQEYADNIGQKVENSPITQGTGNLKKRELELQTKMIQQKRKIPLRGYN